MIALTALFPLVCVVFLVVLVCLAEPLQHTQQLQEVQEFISRDKDNRGGGMKLVDVQIAAAFLGVSRQTIGRMIEGGALTAVPIRTGKRKKVLPFQDYSLKKFLGIPEGKQLVIEPALIHQSPKRTEEEV